MFFRIFKNNGPTLVSVRVLWMQAKKPTLVLTKAKEGIIGKLWVGQCLSLGCCIRIP